MLATAIFRRVPAPTSNWIYQRMAPMRQTRCMSTTAKGFIIILVVGLVVLAIAALADRRSRRLSDGGTAGTDASTPDYQTMTALLRTSSGRPPIDAATQAGLKQAKTLALRLASPDMATHDGRLSVATDTRVLVCDDEITTVRETLPIWAMLPPAQAVTIVAPNFDPDVLEMLAANLLSGVRCAQPLIGDAPARAEIATATGATPQPREELQSGGVPITALGHAALIVGGLTETQMRVL